MRFKDLEEKDIINAVKECGTIRKSLIKLGLCVNNYNTKLLRIFVKEHNLIVKSIYKNTPLSSINKEELEKIILESDSFKIALEKLGYKDIGGGVYTTLKKKIKEFNISTKHMCHKARFNITKKIKKENLFCKDSRHAHSTVRRYIIKNNLIEYKCYYCGNTGIWQNKPLSLTLDHANGDRTDNRLENLRFVCPNCDRQQDTYGSRNRKRYFNLCKVGIDKIDK